MAAVNHWYHSWMPNKSHWVWSYRVPMLDATGAGVTGLTAANCLFWIAVPYTSPASALTPLAFVEVDATNMPGVYELTLNAADVASVSTSTVRIKDNRGSPTALDSYLHVTYMDRSFFNMV